MRKYHKAVHVAPSRYTGKISITVGRRRYRAFRPYLNIALENVSIMFPFLLTLAACKIQFYANKAYEATVLVSFGQQPIDTCKAGCSPRTISYNLYLGCHKSIWISILTSIIQHLSCHLFTYSFSIYASPDDTSFLLQNLGLCEGP